MDTGLRDKVVMITGASGGIGAAAARAFAEEGAKLVLQGNRNMAAFTEENQVRELFRRASEHFGGLDVLVANAADWEADAVPIHKIGLERWNKTVAVVQTSVFLCAQEFFRTLEQTKPEEAALILLGSEVVLGGWEGHLPYNAAKAAVMFGFLNTLKYEILRLVPRGRVNVVCPGWTLTRPIEPSPEFDEALVQILQMRPIQRLARAKDVAPAIVFLASEKLAGQITGEIITTNGGMRGQILHRPEEVDPSAAI